MNGAAADNSTAYLAIFTSWKVYIPNPKAMHACRSGRSLTMVTQYDVELFQKIEALTGHKMEEYPSEQEAVLLLLERVGEAQRISTMQV